tara:strand:- start:435 stop:680 length:246 start_codon:yes stop_codon:yes gene_type:complete
MFRKKQYKKHKQRPNEYKKPHYSNDNTYNKVRSLSPNSKAKRLSQIDKELTDIVFETDYRNSDKYDKLLLERWRLRYELGL